MLRLESTLLRCVACTRRNLSSGIGREIDRLSDKGGDIGRPVVPFVKKYAKEPGLDEKLHKRNEAPGTGGKAYKFPNRNDVIHPPIFGDVQECFADSLSKFKESVNDPEKRCQQQVVLNPPPYVNHMRSMIKYSPKKMWYIAGFVRGMPVDEAIRQLQFMSSKGAMIVREILQEAKTLAVEEHNIEFGTSLWIAESYSTNGGRMKGMMRRNNTISRMGVRSIDYLFCNYFVRLEEGKPPADFYGFHRKTDRTISEWLELYVKKQRSKRIPRA